MAIFIGLRGFISGKSMYIVCDGNWNNPEIEISDLSQNLIKLGELLLSINEDFNLHTVQTKSEFYAENIEAISIQLKQNKNAEQDLIKIFIDNKNLVFEGSKLAFDKLGMSLLNYFNENTQKGEHFHLSYSEGDALLAPTNCHIIFLCRG
jgi:hypothetical protein